MNCNKKRLKRIVRRLIFWKEIIPVKIPVYDPGELLKGKVAIVTGGGSGIGLAISKKLVECGCKVYILGRNKNKLESAANDLGVQYRILDVCQTGNIQSVVNDIFGENAVDILVNSAGALSANRLGDTDLETWEKIFNTNARGTFFMTQAVTNKMKELKIRGHILNISSSSALRPCYNVYTISKHIIKDMTVGFAKELIPYGIVVNAIAPGPTATSMLNADEDDIYNESVPAGRYGTTDEIANMALSLISDMGNMIIGSTLYMTGGCGITTCE